MSTIKVKTSNDLITPKLSGSSFGLGDSFVDSLIPFEDTEMYRPSILYEVCLIPEEGEEYYVTTWSHQEGGQFFSKYTFSYVGKHLRNEIDGNDCYSIFLISEGNEVKVIHQPKTAFYNVKSGTNITKRSIESNIATKLEVVCRPQEGRYYFLTTFTEETGQNLTKKYFTTNPLTYLGRYTGGRSEGWGDDMKNWEHFINDDGKEVIIECSRVTAFYHIYYIPVVRPPRNPPVPLQTRCLPAPVSSYVLSETMKENARLICPACKRVGHRIHTCPDEIAKQSYFDAERIKKYGKEIVVTNKPVEGKYYEATFLTRKDGHWSNETYYTKESTPREYAGKYLRRKQCGYGDSADHWAIFLRDGKEIEIEYDYEGKRAFYEVPARE